MKQFLLPLFIMFFLPAGAQLPHDTAALKALYDRCINFDESKNDSLVFYADYIDAEAKKLNYDRGEVMSSRLRGIAQDLRGEYEKATQFYIQSLEAARKLHAPNYELSALSDLAYVYINIKQPAHAKEMYLASARIADAGKDLHAQLTAYINLGAVYNQLKLHDSALYFLEKGLAMAKPYGQQYDVSSFYNNIGNVYYARHQFRTALDYFRETYGLHKVQNDQMGLWIDELNLADVFIELNNNDSGYFYANKSLTRANQLNSKSKQADSYSMLSKLYAKKGDYKKAFENQRQWYVLDTGLVNSGTTETIASLQEKLHAREREQDNRMLQTQITQAQFRNRIITFAALGAAIIALVIGLLLVQKRRANSQLQMKNEFIQRQNEKLAELNQEKNSLISIVSHDLNTPFAAIKMWLNFLEGDNEKLTDEQVTAITRIRQSATRGELLIRSILDVEKAETNQHKIQLESFDLNILLSELVKDFSPAANGKKIQLSYEGQGKNMMVVSDPQLITRIGENIISNAIKYSPPGKNVWVSLHDGGSLVEIRVKDEGIGISKQDMTHLFSKYGRIASSTPTGGESSTGLGLSIVKRIVDELNGKVICESEPGKGSVFTVTLKK